MNQPRRVAEVKRKAASKAFRARYCDAVVRGFEIDGGRRLARSESSHQELVCCHKGTAPFLAAILSSRIFSNNLCLVR